MMRKLKTTKVVLVVYFVCSISVLICLQIWHYYAETAVSYAYDCGIIVVLSSVWIIILISIFLLFSKTKVFLGKSFSNEKCEIYTMFATLTIGYAVAITMNAVWYKEGKDICSSKQDIKNCKFWLIFTYYLISQWFIIVVIAVMHYKNFKADAFKISEQENLMRSVITHYERSVLR